MKLLCLICLGILASSQIINLSVTETVQEKKIPKVYKTIGFLLTILPIIYILK